MLFPECAYDEIKTTVLWNLVVRTSECRHGWDWVKSLLVCF